MSEVQKEIYRVLDLFAGCGGLSKGLELTGRFKICVANEIWDPAQSTYIANHPETKMVAGDITDDRVKTQIYDEFKSEMCDLIVGGPPCQAYSHAGFRDPEDPRGRLFEDYVRIVEELGPRAFVMENVKGLLTMRHEREDLSDSERCDLEGIWQVEAERRDLLLLRKRHKNNPARFPFTSDDEWRLEEIKKELPKLKKEGAHLFEPVIEIIKRRFRKIGYEVEHKLLNAADYGVAQKRERVILIGVRDKISIEFPEPTHMPPSKNGSLFDQVSWRTVREEIDDLKDLPEMPEWNHIYTTHSDEFIEKIRATEIGKSVFGGYSDAFFKNPPDEPSRTVKENHGGVLVHYEEDRVMTPRELARLQSFPDDFVFSGSKSQILVQIGNAVPPLLGKAVGESIAEILDEFCAVGSNRKAAA